MSDSLRPHESQLARPPCPSPTPRVYSNPCPLSRWCHPTISSSVIPFSSCPQSFPASGPFPMSQLFTWGGQSTGVSASTSVLPMNTQDWSPLGRTGWISFRYHLKSVYFYSALKVINRTKKYCCYEFLEKLRTQKKIFLKVFLKALIKNRRILILLKYICNSH